MGVILPVPMGSMYGIFTYIYHKNQVNVGKYTIPWEPTVPVFFGVITFITTTITHILGVFKNFIFPSVSGVQGYIDHDWVVVSHIFYFHPYLQKISNFD